jgi:hypothetical protein
MRRKSQTTKGLPFAACPLSLTFFVVSVNRNNRINNNCHRNNRFHKLCGRFPSPCHCFGHCFGRSGQKGSYCFGYCFGACPRSKTRVSCSGNHCFGGQISLLFSTEFIPLNPKNPRYGHYRAIAGGSRKKLEKREGRYYSRPSVVLRPYRTGSAKRDLVLLLARPFIVTMT